MRRLMILLLSAFIAVLMLAPSVEAVPSSATDPKGDAQGSPEDALPYGDIAVIRADSVGSEIAVAFMFAKDPYEYLLNNPAATMVLITSVKAQFEKEKLSTIVKVTIAMGSTPEVSFEPEGGIVVFDVYEHKTGWQIRMDVLYTPLKVALACSSKLDIRGGGVTDSVDEFVVESSEEGEIDLLPPFPKVRREPKANRDDRKLNRDSYVPPKGGYGAGDDDEKAQESLKEAQKALTEGKKEAVWDFAEDAILYSSDYKTKFAARNLIYKAGPVPPAPVSEMEEMRVRFRVGQERERYYRELKPSTRLGEIALVKLYHKNASEFGLPTSGLGDYEKMERDYLLKIATEKDESIEEIKNKGGLKALKKEAQTAQEKGELERAYRLFYHYRMELMITEKKPDDISTVDEWMTAIGVKILASTSSDDLKLLEDAVKHPAWDRISVFPSRHFIFIVPKAVESRVVPDSLMRLDVAFTFEADFFSVSATKYSERVTVFLKELWGFRGGTGGGNQINIGYKWAAENHNPAIVDSPLYTHELGHCMTVGFYWFLFSGFTEGIANMAALMAEDCIGRHNSAVSSLENQLKEGKQCFFDRNIPYWRVQNYSPAFTLMGGLIKNKPLVEGAYDWARLRMALRDFNSFPIRPTSLFAYGQAWVKALEPYFGEDVYSYYRSCRFPLEDNSKSILQDDLDFYNTDFAVARMQGMEAMLTLLDEIERENPASYFRQMLMFRIMSAAISSGQNDVELDMRHSLGIVNKAYVIGPCAEGGSGLLAVLEPEEVIKLNAEYRTQRNIARWEAKEANAEGFFTRRTDYSGDWSGFALSYVKVPKDMQARLWVRSRNGFGIWLNGELIEKASIYDARAWDVGSDFAMYTIQLKEGWNRLLGRFSFTSGEGMIRMRITDMIGSAIEGIEFSATDHEKDIPQTSALSVGTVVLEDDFVSGLSNKKWNIGSGKFNVKSGRLNSENGGARRFRWTVVPDEKRDPDPALIWTKGANSDKAQGYRIEMAVEANDNDLPTMDIIFDGMGGNEITSGAALMISSERKGLKWTLCHYDTKYYEGMYEGLSKGLKHTIVFERSNTRYSLTINDKVIFADLSLPTVFRGEIGLAFKKDVLAIDDIKIYSLVQKKK